MVKVQITQILTNMMKGEISYYYTVTGDEKTQGCGYFTCSFDYFDEVNAKVKGETDLDTDVEIVRRAFKHRYDYFRIIIDGKDVTPERKPMNEEIREDLESKDYTLDELFEMLDKEQNIFKKASGIVRITAKFKTIVINELITKKFEDMEASHKAPAIL